MKPDLMIDLSRRLEKDAYHPSKNPKGIIDLGSAVNELMLDDIASWTRWNLKRGKFKDGTWPGLRSFLSGCLDLTSKISRSWI